MIWAIIVTIILVGFWFPITALVLTLITLAGWIWRNWKAEVRGYIEPPETLPANTPIAELIHKYQPPAVYQADDKNLRPIVPRAPLPTDHPFNTSCTFGSCPPKETNLPPVAADALPAITSDEIFEHNSKLKPYFSKRKGQPRTKAKRKRAKAKKILRKRKR